MISTLGRATRRVRATTSGRRSPGIYVYLRAVGGLDRLRLDVSSDGSITSRYHGSMEEGAARVRPTDRRALGDVWRPYGGIVVEHRTAAGVECRRSSSSVIPTNHDYGTVRAADDRWR